MLEEIRIIERTLSGDPESFRLLLQRYQKPVLSMINHIINDSHASQDLAQDVFLAAYKKLASFDPARSTFATWLFTIARNKSLNALKKRCPIPLNELPEKSDPATPYQHLAQKELFQQLDQALKKLPTKQKTALVLAEFENLPYQQIAQIEGISLGTVKSRINRAKKKLQRALGPALEK